MDFALSTKEFVYHVEKVFSRHRSLQGRAKVLLSTSEFSFAHLGYIMKTGTDLLLTVFLVSLYFSISPLLNGRVPSFGLASASLICFYSVTCFLCYWLAVKLARSKWLFSGLALTLTLAVPLFGMIGADQSKLSYSIGGQPIYVDGTITSYGFLYKIISPFLFLFIFSIFYHLKDFIRKN